MVATLSEGLFSSRKPRTHTHTHLLFPPHRYVQQAKQVLSDLIESREPQDEDGDSDDDESSIDSGLSAVPGQSFGCCCCPNQGCCAKFCLRVTAPQDMRGLIHIPVIPLLDEMWDDSEAIAQTTDGACSWRKRGRGEGKSVINLSSRRLASVKTIMVIFSS